MAPALRSMSVWFLAAAALSPALAGRSGPRLCVVPFVPFVDEGPPVVVRPYLPPPAAHVQIAPPPVIVRAYVPAIRFAQPPPVRLVSTPVVVTRPIIVTRPVVVTHPVVVSRPVVPVVIDEPVEDPLVDDGSDGRMDDRPAGLRAARRVVVGGGFGGMILSGDDASTIGSSYRLHVGLALRQASVSLRLDLAPDAVTLPDGSGHPMGASYMITGLGFGYHFNPDGLLHPVMGASVELHSLDPERGDAAAGFGIGGRAGLEMEYPLDFGSLGVGVDFTAHRRLISEDAFPTPTATALAFGGYLDYRF